MYAMASYPTLQSVPGPTPTTIATMMARGTIALIAFLALTTAGVEAPWRFASSDIARLLRLNVYAALS